MNARKVFDLKDQRAKDVYAAITAIEPVISLIREWGKVEDAYEKIVADNQHLSKEIESIRYVMDLAYTEGELKESLSKIFQEKISKYKDNTEKEEKLKAICDKMEREIISYQEYAKLYTWIEVNDIEILLDLKPFEKEEFLSMMFLILNIKASEEVRRKIINKYSSHISEYGINSLLGSGGWNYMLKNLKANVL